jgi:hypothetical protein
MQLDAMGLDNVQAKLFQSAIAAAPLIFVNLAKLISKKYPIFLLKRSCSVKVSQLNGEMECPVT